MEHETHMELRDDLVSGHQSSDHTYRENVVLAGITGAGKSTAGKQLALLLGMGFIDLDAMVERMTGKSINAIFESGSENEFREAERQALESVTNIKSHVIALGGGALQDKSCLDMVRKIGVLIWLKPTPDEVARRMFMRVQELEKRPMFRDLVSIEQKDERRAAIRDRIAATFNRHML